ncbi:MAG: lasso peptide biosynthesis B2 protein [Cyanobacteria bacterium P01_F01_bin.116]
MLILRKLRKAYRNSPLLLEAIFWLGIARLVILTLPFRWVEPYLGQRMTESPMDVLPAEPQQLKKLAWAVNKMSRFTPWQSKCLVQAMAAKRMLQSRKIVSTLYLGVARSNPRPLEAHAWLRSGPVYLTGGQGHKHFTVVAMFAEEG